MVDPTLLAPHLVSTLLGSKLRETGRRCLQLHWTSGTWSLSEFLAVPGGHYGIPAGYHIVKYMK